MRKALALLISPLLILSACSGGVGGAGQLSNGEPIAGSVIGEMPSGRTIVEVASPAGWTCRSVVTDQAGNGISVTVPITCSNGRNGTMILTMNNIQKTLYGSFRLDNGLTGQISFAFSPG